MKTKSWYAIAKEGERAEVRIYDEIGFWGVTAREFVEELNDLDVKAIDLRLNTPGGSVFDGNAIYNALKRHPADITVHIDGLAASMGSIIALAGDHVNMAQNGLYMVHNPWTLAIGDSRELRDTADVLDKLRGGMISTYSAKTGKDAEEVTAIMDAETWYSADEALEAGFIDEITQTADGAAAKMKAAVAKFKNAPEIEEEADEASDIEKAEDNTHAAIEVYQLRQKLNEREAE